MTLEQSGGTISHPKKMSGDTDCCTVLLGMIEIAASLLLVGRAGIGNKLSKEGDLAAFQSGQVSEYGLPHSIFQYCQLLTQETSVHALVEKNTRLLHAPSLAE